MLYPKIGIRPVIDGRWGGVRESLEAQTMAMAENAAKLISENVKYPDGTPVQCVIGCTTIGGGAEAARVAEQFSTQNVTATLSVSTSPMPERPFGYSGERVLGNLMVLPVIWPDFPSRR